jgi:hypothetical protein
MQIVCNREGRMGFHVGDVLEVPDGTETIDYTYFRLMTDEEKQAGFKRQSDEAAAKAEAEANAKAEVEKLNSELNPPNPDAPAATEAEKPGESA